MSVSQNPPPSLKRDHDSFDFDDLTDLEQPFRVPPELVATYEEDSGEGSMPTPPVSVGNNHKREEEAIYSRSRSASLTDPASTTPSLGGGSPVPSPSAFAALNGSAAPPAKKAKLTFTEKEMKRIQKEIKDQERAEDKARRDAERDAEKARKDLERQAQAEEKARRDAEKDAEKRKKEFEKEQRRLAQEAEKAAKEEKKRRKEEEKQRAEEEKQRAEEEKRKKGGKQKTLGSFFTIPATTVARRNSLDGSRRSESPAASNPSLRDATVAGPAESMSRKSEKTAYEKMFGDFFVYANVTMAPINRFEKDEEASELLHCTLDSYILGNQSPGRRREFDASSLFHLSGHDSVTRGKRCMPVREIMAQFSGNSTRPIDLTTDSQNSQIKRTNDCLRKIPLKFLKFREDVRPPYRGTFTSRPVNGTAKLARNPMRRDLFDTNYDYDSEAEWIEDEDAEDLNSEGEEDEELGEDGEDMEGFLDDENDEIANSKRLVLQGDLEPVSTGLCWEDRTKRNTNVKMMPYRMEIILGKFGHHLNWREMLMSTDHTMKSIDPFSTQYWEPTPPAVTKMDPPRLPLNALKSNSSTVNSLSNSKPVKPFFTSAADLLKLNPQNPSKPIPQHLQPQPQLQQRTPSRRNSSHKKTWQPSSRRSKAAT